MENTIKDEILQLKMKLIELEFHQKQKEIKDTYAKTQTVEYHMENILNFWTPMMS
jgi:hypothetical protein